MDRIEDASVFVQVAERGSFADAARHLNRSPAAISRAVAELEARLGVRLLTRTTRAVSMTDAGQRFLVGAKRVIADLEEIELAAAGQGRAPRGELRVTAPIVFGRKHLLQLVLEFLSQYREVSVRLMLLDRPVDLVEDGLDVALRIGSLANTSAVATRVGEVNRVSVASPDYLAGRPAPLAPRDLDGHDLISFNGLDAAGRWHFGGADNGIDVAVKPRLIVTTAEAALDAALAGFGLTRLLSYQAVEALADGKLVRVLKEYETEPTPIHLVYPDGKHPAPKLRMFLDWTAPRLRQRCEAISRALTK
ncbi:MAG: LysR family transcriptional regulator [Pseudolabrys sp.]|nr:LysR family transcriptional regulator [Pseudolabrys sp.]